MGEERRSFSAEFKIEAVRAMTGDHKPITQLARELGVRTDQLYRWKRQLEDHEAGTKPSDVFPGNGKQSELEEEVRRLRRENTQLREEREILRKATAFFAKESR